MSASYSDIQSPQQTRKGLAIASLVLGIISIPTLGLLLVGAIAGIVLGAVALIKTRKEPMTYGGKGMAIAGIVSRIEDSRRGQARRGRHARLFLLFPLKANAAL